MTTPRSSWASSAGIGQECDSRSPWTRVKNWHSAENFIGADFASACTHPSFARRRVAPLRLGLKRKNQHVACAVVDLCVDDAVLSDGLGSAYT